MDNSHWSRRIVHVSQNTETIYIFTLSISVSRFLIWNGYFHSRNTTHATVLSSIIEYLAMFVSWKSILLNIFSFFPWHICLIYILFRSLFARYLHAATWKLMLLALAVSGIPPRMSFFLNTLNWYLSDKLTGLQYYGQRSFLVLEFLIRLKLNINLSTWWVIRACSCSWVRCSPRPGSQIMKRQSPINRLSLYIILSSLWLS